MTSLTPTAEGNIPFSVQIPGKEQKNPCTTYYKIFGDISATKVPRLVVVHGGPGAAHEYLLSFAALWDRYGIPVVFYDQIGCGASSHLPETRGDISFWKEELFIAELENLLDHLKLRDGPGFHLLGQSWGGLLGAAYAARRPRGLQRLVLASALASIDLSIRSIELRREEMPQDIRDSLTKCLGENDYESPQFREAAALFSKSFVCRADPFPPELIAGLRHLAEDTTVYGTMYGPSVFNLNGSLSGWTCIPQLQQIEAPTLVYNGEFDTSHDIGQEPFFELIPRVRWITFPDGGHMCHLEPGLAERVLKVVGEFLAQHKSPK